MPTPSLMLSQEKSCRRCSKQTGNPKTSKDGKFSSRVRKTQRPCIRCSFELTFFFFGKTVAGWVASRSGRCCILCAKTRTGFSTRILSGRSMMAACLKGWSKRGRLRRNRERRSDKNITNTLLCGRICKLWCECGSVNYNGSLIGSVCLSIHVFCKNNIYVKKLQVLVGLN